MTWSRDYPSCVACSTTSRLHFGGGLCASCYRKKWVAGAGERRWARDYESCVRCSSTERRHAARGLCNTCYQAVRLLDPERRLISQANNKKYSTTERRRACLLAYNSNPETKRRKWFSQHERRETRAGIWVPLPPDYRALALEAFDNRCANCGTSERLELDHHRPLEDGHALYGNSSLFAASATRASTPRGRSASTMAGASLRLQFDYSSFGSASPSDRPRARNRKAL